MFEKLPSEILRYSNSHSRVKHLALKALPHLICIVPMLSFGVSFWQHKIFHHHRLNSGSTNIFTPDYLASVNSPFSIVSSTQTILFYVAFIGFFLLHQVCRSMICNCIALPFLAASFWYGYVAY